MTLHDQESEEPPEPPRRARARFLMGARRGFTRSIGTAIRTMAGVVSFETAPESGLSSTAGELLFDQVISAQIVGGLGGLNRVFRFSAARLPGARVFTGHIGWSSAKVAIRALEDALTRPAPVAEVAEMPWQAALDNALAAHGRERLGAAGRAGEVLASLLVEASAAAYATWRFTASAADGMPPATALGLGLAQTLLTRKLAGWGARPTPGKALSLRDAAVTGIVLETADAKLLSQLRAVQGKLSNAAAGKQTRRNRSLERHAVGLHRQRELVAGALKQYQQRPEQ